MKNTLSIITLLILFGCGKSATDNSLEFRTVSQNFRTHDKLDVYYKSFQVVGDSLLVYNKFKHELIFLDLKKDTINTVPLELNGPNGIDSPIGFVYTNNKEVVLADDFSIALLTKDGLKRKTISLSDENIYEERNQLYGNPAYLGYRNHLIYNNNRKEVFLYFQKSPNESIRSIFGVLDLSNNKVSPIDINYPEIYDNVEFTGRLFQLSTTQSDEGAYFVFSGSPEIKYVDFNTSNVVTKSVISFEGKQNSDPPLDYEATEAQFNDYLLSNPFFNQISFDENTGLLYRISSPVIGINDSSDPNFFNNRQFILTVMDKKMNVLGNIELEKGRYDGNFLFGYSEGIWLSLNRSLQMNEDLIQGDLIKLKDFHY